MQCHTGIIELFGNFLLVINVHNLQIYSRKIFYSGVLFLCCGLMVEFFWLYYLKRPLEKNCSATVLAVWYPVLIIHPCLVSLFSALLPLLKHAPSRFYYYWITLWHLAVIISEPWIHGEALKELVVKLKICRFLVDVKLSHITLHCVWTRAATKTCSSLSSSQFSRWSNSCAKGNLLPYLNSSFLWNIFDFLPAWFCLFENHNCDQSCI